MAKPSKKESDEMYRVYKGYKKAFDVVGIFFIILFSALALMIGIAFLQNLPSILKSLF